ncbi:hypothetical protein JDV02_003699 [Purpureocillium takamizusanense]|uniref:GH64 domain-containing protein n=1 Tax=Purpureocillium takamizusanense TaxID=2060973 RepID=A0A9Q8QDN8_9HYPO|nr:uncharacterized protein JDV02_003699 [Purpureocillium takamizusanense]UNI17352.1 hypothetical protein JDV02_003699 [Purpureocillium takamizusanense]
MLFINSALALLWAASSASAARDADGNSTVIGQPKPVEEVIVTADNTVNGTYVGPDTTVNVLKSKLSVRDNTAAAQIMAFKLRNNKNKDFYAYIEGRDSSGHAVLVGADGIVVTPSSKKSSTPRPIDDTPAIRVPANTQGVCVSVPRLEGGRVYFSDRKLLFSVVHNPATDMDSIVGPNYADDNDPNTLAHYDFIEFNQNHGDGAFGAATNSVKMIGLPFELRVSDGSGRPKPGLGVSNQCLDKLCELAINEPASGLKCLQNAKRENVRVVGVKEGNVYDPLDAFTKSDRFKEACLNNGRTGLGQVGSARPRTFIIDVGERR